VSNAVDPSFRPQSQRALVVKVTSPSFSQDPTLRAELTASFGGAVFNETGARFDSQQLAEYLCDADAAIVGLERIDDALLGRCRRLRIIAKYGVGLDGIDLDACDARGIRLGWTAGVNCRSVAEQTVGFLLGLFRNLFMTSTRLRGGHWYKQGGRQLSGATVGIIGLGHVGRDVVHLLKPFDCRIFANDIADVSPIAALNNVELVDKDELYARSDAVTLHVPLTPLTRRLVDESAICKFKPGAFLVNTSRGEIVDQIALKRALIEGRLAGAALDVFDVEPPTDRELLELPTFVGTPHIGGNSREAILAMGRSAIGHLQRFFLAEPEAAG
jgi:phosphoglycerate dehydrogenase-like enzyme